MAKAKMAVGTDGMIDTNSGTVADAGTLANPDTGETTKRAKRPAPRAKPRPPRQAVVGLAMHRTGSSALSRILNLAGCDLPQTLMGGDASNQTGHWESTVVRALDDDILASGGSNWQDWHAFNPRWYQTTRPAEFRSRAEQVLDDEYGKTGLMVIKDPRICRIFPFWRDLLEKSGVSASVLMPLRHPAEVAASLNGRNSIPEVHGLLLWLRHVLEAEHASRQLPRAVVLYDRLMSRPVETMQALQEPLGVIWPRMSEIVSAEIGEFMVPDLRHHKADQTAISLLPFHDWLIPTYAIFEKWSKTGEDVKDHDALDDVRLALNRMAAPLTQVVATVTRQATDIATMDKDISYLRFEAGKRGDAVAALTAEKLALIETARAEQQSLTGRLAETQSALRQRQHEAEETSSALTAARKELDASKAERDALLKAQGELQKQLLENQTAFRKRQHEAEETVEALTRSLHKTEAAEAARYDEIAELTHALIVRDAAITANVARINRAIDAMLRRAERPWLLGPLRLARQVALLSASGLFDADWYRQVNLDVAKSGMNPARHFIRFGRAEGRHPLPDLAHAIAGLPKPLTSDS